MQFLRLLHLYFSGNGTSLLSNLLTPVLNTMHFTRFIHFSCTCLVLFLVMAVAPQQVSAAVPAFPGAEGFGAGATGGRGGTVYYVTNLNTSGSGSFTECVKQSNTTCIFKVGGAINYGTEEVIISGSNLTIAGQTAPGGITIRGALTDDSGSALVNLQGSNIIIRHIAIRGGGDPLRLVGAKNIMLDHISLSWATDENFGGTQASDNVSMQWSLIGEGIIGHSKAIIMTTGANRFSFHHNLFAHNEERHPRLQTGQVEFINNIIFNHKAGSTIEVRSGHDFVPIQLNYIGNLMILGPQLSPGDTWYNKNLSIKSGVSVYVEDNNHGYAGTPTSTKNSFSMSYPISVEPASAIRDKILQRAGAFHFSRDPVDTRIVDETNKGIKNPNYATSYPQISEVRWPNYTLQQSSASDSDNDGIPDSWESSHGLNPNNAADGAQITGSGYSNLELYLNELAQGENVPVPTPVATPPIVEPTPEPTPEIPDPTPEPTPEPPPTPVACPLDADLSNDDRVDIDDYSLLVRDFFKEGEDLPADINCDGLVDIEDYGLLIGKFTTL